MVDMVSWGQTYLRVDYKVAKDFLLTEFEFYRFGMLEGAKTLKSSALFG